MKIDKVKLKKCLELNKTVINLVNSNNPDIWNYIIGVILKHAVIHSSKEELLELKSYIIDGNSEAIANFLENKLPIVKTGVIKDIVNFHNNLIL